MLALPTNLSGYLEKFVKDAYTNKEIILSRQYDGKLVEGLSDNEFEYKEELLFNGLGLNDDLDLSLP